MSTTTSHPTLAERLGRWLGRAARGYLRREQSVAHRLVANGMPATGASALLWTIKLTLLAVLFYVTFWFALLLAFLVAVAWGADEVDLNTPEPEWEHGPVGYGLYSDDGYRLDAHDPDHETRL
ncbi:DUF3742 family protein [Achromobacter sp. Marseille-Q0513]|uniref:DUF3742 family protein n=1 Tax=Achromobacter sp. Marseille-Q0513 TaxID=2829161 RepID=UPI001B8E3086|nr:DUF3742 family protein [Achromobacter sp. Marseille-Q0513]MBR8657745.1 DUF3742 family protein [Achromobacter sp. Marseille-Q0513]